MADYTRDLGVNVDWMHPLIRHAINEIYSTYGDVVSVNEKAKSLLKFGQNALVGTSQATVMTLPAGILAETYVTTNAIDSVSSSDNGDTQLVYVEGHTIDGDGNLTFISQTVTLPTCPSLPGSTRFLLR